MVKSLEPRLPLPFGGFLDRMARVPYSPFFFIFVPAVVVLVQGALEGLLNSSPWELRGLLHLYTDYVLVQALLVTALAFACGRSYRDVTGVVSLGLVLGWLPRILQLIAPERRRWFDHFSAFEWNLAAPYLVRWETLMAWMAVALGGLFVLRTTRRVIRGVAAAVGVYVALQGMAWGVPALAGVVSRRLGLGGNEIHGLMVVVIVLGLYVGWNHRTMLPSLLRMNRALPWALLAAIGARMAGQSAALAGAKAVIMGLAVLLVAFTNDYFDRAQDAALGGKPRPVGRDDVVIALHLQVLLVLWVMSLEPSAAYLLMLFFALGMLYHLPGLRLKRLFCASYKIEGGSAAAAFLFGVVGSHGFPAQGRVVAVYALLVLGGFALGAMFKDYKDIDEDRAARVGTVYTRYLARGHSLSGIHRIVSLATSAALLVPPVWLLHRGAGRLAPVVLLLVSPLPAVLLLRLRNRERAVELTVWALSAYLAVLLAGTPTLW